MLLGLTLVVLAAAVVAAAEGIQGGQNPDLPAISQDADANGNYLALRAEYDARLRGIEPGLLLNPALRPQAVAARRRQESQLDSPARTAAVWSNIGPLNIFNGQAVDGSPIKVSGRVTSIALDPTNSSRAYVGTAQGGVWRTTDGGTSWTPIFDGASTLSVGALALAPSDPTKLYVGTGEADNACDGFFGVGLYRIDNPATTATLVGPINPSMTYTFTGGVGTFTTTAFGGRGITQLLVSPADAGTVFVSTGQAVSGMGCNTVSNTIGPVALAGVYRSTNAGGPAALVTFQKLAATTEGSFDSPPTGNTAATDMAFVANDPNTLLVGFSGAGGPGGGVSRSADALAATPTFAQTLAPGSSGLWFRLAASGTTVFAASSEFVSGSVGSGRLRKSTDGGQTWTAPITAVDGFCTSQCVYDEPVGIDPNTSGATLRVYLGGQARSTYGDVLKVSNNGGTTWNRTDNGLHADSHVIAFDATTTPSTIWFGTDGGIWKRDASLPIGSPYTNLNNGLATLQYQSIAVGASDPLYTIGGTQDNGTQKRSASSGIWLEIDFGDGGYSLIDQSTTSTSAVTLYHTYYNVNSSQGSAQIGFARTTASSAAPGSWTFLGCSNNVSGAGIACTDNVEFYAPMALGPGTPNNVYFGSDRLYRSTNQGTTNTVVSQAPIVQTSPGPPAIGVPITTIAVSHDTAALTNDNVRLVGLQNGSVWATTTGSSTLSDVSPPAPANANGSTSNKWVGRVVIDPNNANTAYVTYSYYASTGAGQNVWKTTNLSAPTPTWTAAASGIPNVPVNAFVVDPADSTHLYAGTDIGVYASTDGGSTWLPFGTGLPAVAVFDMAIARPGTPNEVLRIATHGRAMWETSIGTAPTGVTVTARAARRTAAGVVLTWRTESETAIAGFVVTRNGTRLNRALIPARYTGRARGGSYRFLVRGAGRGVYRLQVVGLNGNRTAYVLPVR